jgi:hypothetical protein
MDSSKNESWTSLLKNNQKVNGEQKCIEKLN